MTRDKWRSNIREQITFYSAPDVSIREGQDKQIRTNTGRNKNDKRKPMNKQYVSIIHNKKIRMDKQEARTDKEERTHENDRWRLVSMSR